MRKRGGWGRARGFTLFEFGLVTTLVAVLSMNLLHRLEDVRRSAQRTAARQVLSAVEAAFRTRLASTGGDRAALTRLAAENPVSWLDRAPANYRGEADPSVFAAVPEDSWVFDRRDKTLVYLPPGYKSLSFPSTTFLRFKVEFPQIKDYYLSAIQPAQGATRATTER